MSDEVDFLHFSKHQSFLQVDLIFCDRFFQECPKFPDKFSISSQNLNKEVKNISNFWYVYRPSRHGNYHIHVSVKDYYK